MNTAFSYIRHSLHGFYPESEIRLFAYLFIEKMTGLTRAEIMTNKNTIFSDEQQKQLLAFVEKLKKKIPIQYILGETEFYGLPFEVNSAVLIPRPETEELVEWIKGEGREQKNAKLLDIGTGSGCIAIALKKEFPLWQVDAFDVSEQALLVAQKNAVKNGLIVDFKQVDILNPPEMDEKWDIIVSNPPYIPEREKDFMEQNVLCYEPSEALFVPDNDPLLFYRTIAHFALKNLEKNGKLFFEIHYDAAEEMQILLEALGFKNIIVRKDISENDRMVFAEV